MRLRRQQRHQNPAQALAQVSCKASQQGLAQLQGGGRHMVHVVVPVLGQPANEADAGLGIGRGRVALKQRLIGRARDRVVRLALGLRKLPHHGGAGHLLTGQKLELGASGVGVAVRVVERAAGLAQRSPAGVGKVPVLEAQAAVGQWPQAAAKVVVNGPGVDRVRRKPWPRTPSKPVPRRRWMLGWFNMRSNIAL